MTTPSVSPARRLLLPLCAALAAVVTTSGCSTTEPQHATEAPRAAAPVAAPAAPSAAANFTPALRCMDTLLADYGVRDITVMVDDLADQTKGNAAGAKDLLVATVANMTQRSRAIRVIASGKEWGNTAAALAAMKKEGFAVAPQFALRGAMTLQDGQTLRRGNDTYSTSQLGIDLSLLTTQDFSVVPGVASRNAATLFKQGRSFDGRAELAKFGVNFGIASNGNAVTADSTKALIELTSIELFGRLARVPYWTCLGMSEAHAGVSGEIQDWYDTIASNRVELIRYFQAQLRLRRVYEGPIDGAPNEAFKEAVARYREALGLAREAKLTLDLFKAYLNADHVQLAQVLNPPVQVATAAPVAPVPVAPAPAPLAAPAPQAPVTTPRPALTAAPATTTKPSAGPMLSLRIATSADPRPIARKEGQAIQLSVRPSRDAHIYCYMQDHEGKVKRFFPNRWRSDSRVQVEGVRLPGAMGFVIPVESQGARESIACFATERDVLAQLPEAFDIGDFDAMPGASLDQVKSAFVKATNGAVAQETIVLRK